MGKRIIQQARGHGGPRYRVRKKAYIYRIKYPNYNVAGEGAILKLINSAAHTSPLAKIKVGKEIFFNLAHHGAYEGQKIKFNISGQAQPGDILKLKEIPVSSQVYNIEKRKGDGGKFIRAGGTSGTIHNKAGDYVEILMPSKKIIKINEECRGSVGIISGSGRVDKPFMKAGSKHYLMKARGKLWPKTSAVSMNVVDHPFGSGRGKRITHGMKGKIAKVNAPPGAKVGLIRPRRTGRKGRKG